MNHQQPVPMMMVPTRVQALAPHETLELHELVALKSNTLIKQKEVVTMIKDPELRNLYLRSIAVLERDIRELAGLLQRSPF